MYKPLELSFSQVYLTKAKPHLCTRDMAQVVECLLCKRKTPSSNPSPTQKKKEKEKRKNWQPHS
jgi:hypothetical protein